MRILKRHFGCNVHCSSFCSSLNKMLAAADYYGGTLRLKTSRTVKSNEIPTYYVNL